MNDDLINAWKHTSIFDEQLQCNLSQLESTETYPEHWNVSLDIIAEQKPNSLLDIGCGCGAFSEVCHRHFPSMKYCGCDYSSAAIDLANETWKNRCFFEKDIMDMTTEDVSPFDMVYTSALFDVSPIGDELLEHLLSIRPQTILLSRIKIVDVPSFYRRYTAYSGLETCAFYHNSQNLVDMFDKHNYTYICKNDHILLRTTE